MDQFRHWALQTFEGHRVSTDVFSDEIFRQVVKILKDAAAADPTNDRIKTMLYRAEKRAVGFRGGKYLIIQPLIQTLIQLSV
jgi:hypothetical protein